MYKVVDLFSGVGGLSFGFDQDKDFEILAANEILPNMAMAYHLNHPTVKMYNMDIKDLNISLLKRDLNDRIKDTDIVIGGPPCQAYSTVGKRLIDDPRGRLFQEYYRILRELNPKVFVFENVKGLLSINKGLLIKEIIKLFESVGYHVDMKLLNAADYGTPQIRERVILVGNRLGKQFEYPEPTHYDPTTVDLFVQTKELKPYLTLRDAIGDLPAIESGQEAAAYDREPQNEYQTLMRRYAPSVLMDHNAPKNNKKMIKLMEALPDGGSPKDLPEDLRPKSGFPNTYCRLWWNKPCTTITRNLGTPSSSRCIHPKQARPLTTREGARIQGFPDEYRFYGPRSDRNLQIGNAVPTFLSIALKNSIKQFLER